MSGGWGGGAAWGTAAPNGTPTDGENLDNVIAAHDTFTGDGVTTTFTLSHSTLANYKQATLVSVRGLKNIYVDSDPVGSEQYTVSGNQLIFGAAPTNESPIEAHYWRS